MSTAPKSILIHGDEGGPSENESTTPTEAPPSTLAEPGGSANASHPKPTSDLAQIIKRYETLEAQSDPGIPFSILALVFLLGGPILALSEFSGATDLEEAANLCCGGLIIGFLLLLVASSQSHAYRKEVNQAFGAVKANLNLPEPPKRWTLLITALAMMGGGWLLGLVESSGTLSFLPLIGVILFCSGLLTFALWLVTTDSGDNRRTKKRILAAAKSRLQHREEE